MIQFSKFELKKDDKLRVIWSIFYCYETMSLTEVDPTVGRSTKDILKMLKYPEPSVRSECNVKYFDIYLMLSILLLIYVVLSKFCKCFWFDKI